MEFILKVSPKGHVILPKKLREKLKVTEMVSIEITDSEGILKKPEISSEKLAGSLKQYAAKKKIPSDKALDQAREMTAREIARKDR